MAHLGLDLHIISIGRLQENVFALSQNHQGVTTNEQLQPIAVTDLAAAKIVNSFPCNDCGRVVTGQWSDVGTVGKDGTALSHSDGLPTKTKI